MWIRQKNKKECKKMFILGFILISVVWLYFYLKYFKLIKLRNFSFCDGTLGSGKSFFSVYCAVKQYEKNCRIVMLQNFFRKILKKELLEKPLLYSNIKLKNIPFVLLDKNLLYRQNYRFAYKSVCLIDEMSLMADQMTYKDKELNERLSQFVKLFRHQTKGGYLIVNSQSVCDLHYTMKYSMSDYIYIHSRKSILRLFSILRLEERIYNADGTATQVNENDIEKKLKIVIIPNRYYKYYDTYCYSIFTDTLPIKNDVLLFDKKDSLKADELISFKEYLYLYENFEKENVKNGK